MKSLYQFRLLDELKASDTQVRISDLIGWKDEHQLPKKVEFEKETIVFQNGDGSVFEMAFWSAQNWIMTLLKRGLDENNPPTEKEYNKKTWGNGTKCYITAGAGDFIDKDETGYWNGKQIFEAWVVIKKALEAEGQIDAKRGIKHPTFATKEEATAYFTEAEKVEWLLVNIAGSTCRWNSTEKEWNALGNANINEEKVLKNSEKIASLEEKVTQTTTELNKLSGWVVAFNKEYYSLDALKKGEDFGFVPELIDEDYFGMVAVGSAAANKVHKIKGFLSGENFNSIDLFLSKTLTPSHNLIISIRDYKTNALINNNARVEIQPANIKNIKEKVTVTFPGMITGNQKWKAVVVQVETPIDNPNNYYVLYANYKFNNLAEEVNDISTVLFKNTKAEDKIESTASTVWPDFMTITGDGRNYQWFTLKKPIEWDFEIEREWSIMNTYSWSHFFGLTWNSNRTWPIAIFQYSRDKRWTGILNHSGNNNIWQYHDWQFHVWKIKREGNKAYFYVDWTLKGQLEVNTIPVYFAGQTYDNWSLMKLKYIKISKLIKKSYIHYYSIGLISDIVLKATPQIDSRYLYPTTNISTMEWWVFTMYGFVDTWIKWVFWIWEDWKLSQSPKIVLWEDDFFYGEQEPGLSPWPYIVAFGWTKNWNSTETKQFICPKKSFCKMSFNLNTSNYWGDSRCHIKLKKNWKELQALSKNWDWTSEIYFIIPKGLIDVELYTRNTSGYDPYMYYNIYIQSDLSS